ncbi:ABC transporter substrate-binding protein [Cellulosimicrobium marinum]|uniref:ABC transporter substrate-binding protein n=1 Tax=Cellulosimicrobium marinum TaxID=1638992 RepID=UPI001E304CAD|nr:ABC transporter substrate-binding protein [Cellulosimicrobium marinum]MCB7137472.1 ABC transporter substrate-binding protein [Cellulosimicrobium marinum]
MRTRLSLVAATAATALVLTGCSGADGTDADTGATASGDADTAGALPVTVEHALGSTTVESADRPASVGWINHDVAIALGVVPVVMPTQAYGDDDGDGVLPWVEAGLEDLGVTEGADDYPVVFDDTDGVAFATIAEAQPDVVLGSYSGLTQEEYDQLTGIAPTVAYPEVAWGTAWREIVTGNAEALGVPEEGDALVAEMEETIAAAAAEQPSLEGRTVAFFYVDPTDLGTIGFYTPLDPRVSFLEDLGLQMPASVVEASADVEGFYTTVSAENADLFIDVDMIVTYGDDALLATMQDDPLLGTIPAIESGAVALLEDGSSLAGAFSPPSPLSLDWGLDEYVALLGAAADDAS